MHRNLSPSEEAQDAKGLASRYPFLEKVERETAERCLRLLNGIGIPPKSERTWGSIDTAARHRILDLAELLRPTRGALSALLRHFEINGGFLTQWAKQRENGVSGAVRRAEQPPSEDLARPTREILNLYPFLAEVRGAKDIRRCTDLLGSIEIPDRREGRQRRFDIGEKKALLAIADLLGEHRCQHAFLAHYGLSSTNVTHWREDVALAEKSGEVPIGTRGRRHRRRRPGKEAGRERQAAPEESPPDERFPEEKRRAILAGALQRAGKGRELAAWYKQNGVTPSDVIRWQREAAASPDGESVRIPEETGLRRFFSPFVEQEDHEDYIKAILPVLLDPLERHECEKDARMEENDANGNEEEETRIIPGTKRSHAFRVGFAKTMNALGEEELERLRLIVNSAADADRFDEWCLSITRRFGLEDSEDVRAFCSQVLEFLRYGQNSDHIRKSASRLFPPIARRA